MAIEFRYEKLKWKEIDEAAQRNRVVVIPIACVEDHGPHLPLDVDIVIITDICHRAAKLIPEKTLVFPTQHNGYDPHHMDFPGTITISETGVMGDPTKASRQKGEQVLQAAGEGLRDIICELSERQVRRRIDHHTSVRMDLAPNTWEIEGGGGI